MRPFTILVVEDESLVRKLVARMLRGLGHSVLEAQSGEEADSLVKDSERGPDLIIADISMPRVSGPRVVEQIRKTCPDAKVLYMSGYSGMACRNHAPLNPGATVLLKPFDQQDLVKAIDQVMAAGGAMHTTPAS